MIEPNGVTSGRWRADLSGRDAFLTFFLIIVATIWVLLFVRSLDSGAAPASFDYQATNFFLRALHWENFCWSPTFEVSVALNIAMWGLMTIGMMLPTATPMIGAYFTLALARPSHIKSRDIWGLCGGYVAVWLAFSIGAGFAQWELAQLGLVSAHGVSVSAFLSVSLLLMAGLYQFSAIKAACLSRCRSPLSYFISAWRDGLVGAFNMGVRHGLDCLGCCWALMLLAFVGGTMNLIWMGLATGLMVLEKLPSIGRPLTKPLGVLLVGGAICIGSTAILGN